MDFTFRNMLRVTLYLIVLLFIRNGSILTAQQLPEGFSAEVIADGLNPVAMTLDHHDRIWLVEKDGKVWIVETTGQLLPDPFISLEVDDFNERGLLGIALHPDMDNQPYVYLYYTVPSGKHNRVSRFLANGDLAVPGSEEIILDLDTISGAIHNGGALLFDNDGYLYIATGDSGHSPNAQNFENLLGKILRLHDDGSIPTDNPFYETTQRKYRAIWCVGLRNPFNMTYDPLPDLIFATDVGGGSFEEVNLIRPGQNYGWPLIEGPRGDQTSPENYQDPYYSYPYDIDSACAIVALGIYKPVEPTFGSSFQNAIFFADYCGGQIYYLEDGNPERVRSFASGLDRPLNILVNPKSGDLYFQTRAGLGGGSAQDNTSTTNGQLWRVFYKGNGIPEIVNQLQDVTHPVGENASFAINAIGSDPLQYHWFVKDHLVANLDSPTLIISELSLADHGTKIHCIVSNAEGSDTSNVATVSVLNDTRPVAEIIHPTDGGLFKAGDTITFQGQGHDREDGQLSTNQLSWQVDLHHRSHTHPMATHDSSAAGYFVIPTFGETDTNIWIRLYLTVEDKQGLQGGTYIELYPDLTEITLTSKVSARINIDGALRQLPHTFPSLKGLTRNIEVPSVQQLGDLLVTFKGWEDGWEDALRTIQTPLVPGNFEILFDTTSLGFGTGLYGEYFNKDLEHDLDESPTMVRIDSTIDFGWGDQSPESGVIDRDFFSVRWRGFLQPLFSEEYTLSITSDDGARVWINNELVWEHWKPQATTEHAFNYEMLAGERYRIRIEYFERDGGAAVHFGWQSDRNKREIVPVNQMYPMGFGQLQGTVWLDSNEDKQIDVGEPLLNHANVLLFDNHFRLIDDTETDGSGIFRFANQEQGAYYLHIVPFQQQGQILPGYGLDASSFSGPITIEPGGEQILRFAFYSDQITADDDQDLPKKFVIYPNPVSSTLHINAFKTIDSWIMVNELGRCVMQSSDGFRNHTFEVINCQALPDGIYFIQLHTKAGISIRKVVKTSG